MDLEACWGRGTRVNPPTPGTHGTGVTARSLVSESAGARKLLKGWDSSLRARCGRRQRDHAPPYTPSVLRAKPHQVAQRGTLATHSGMGGEPQWGLSSFTPCCFAWQENVRRGHKVTGAAATPIFLSPLEGAQRGNCHGNHRRPSGEGPLGLAPPLPWGDWGPWGRRGHAQLASWRTREEAPNPCT